VVDAGATPAGTFTSVDAGQAHNCGIKTDGTVACWGFNSKGETNPPGGTFKQ
jgi:alpha-tubulin suppressor-like RCC1 family protein